jgi:hypothetical protein
MINEPLRNQEHGAGKKSCFYEAKKESRQERSNETIMRSMVGHLSDIKIGHTL